MRETSAGCIRAAEHILAQLAQEWHVGEPHERILQAQTNALLAIAKQGEPVEATMAIEERDRQRTVYVVSNTATGALIAIHATPESAEHLVDGRENLEVNAWRVL